MNITIRPYMDEDQDAVIQLWEKVFPGAPAHNNPVLDRRTRQEVPPELFLVALRRDELAGLVMASCDGHQGWVHYLGVDPTNRRQGIGTALMKQVEVRLLSMDCRELHFQIWASKAEVQAFYETLGYLAEDRLTMGKRL